jgi:hypothetical protein
MLPLVSPVECPAIVRFVEPASSSSSSSIHSPLDLNLDSPGCLSQPVSSLLQLDFSDLPSFSIVRDQYQAWGVVIAGAMAIQPSNPAFIDATHSTGLMPTVDNQPLTIYFQQMRRLASLRLVGAQQITLRAYDANNHLVAEQQVGQPDYRQSRRAVSICARHQVQLAAKEIARLEIHSDAPFLLHGLIWS